MMIPVRGFSLRPVVTQITILFARLARAGDYGFQVSFPSPLPFSSSFWPFPPPVPFSGVTSRENLFFCDLCLPPRFTRGLNVYIPNHFCNSLQAEKDHAGCCLFSSSGLLQDASGPLCFRPELRGGRESQVGPGRPAVPTPKDTSPSVLGPQIS